MSINEYKNWSTYGAINSTVLFSVGGASSNGKLYIVAIYEEDDELEGKVYRLVVKYGGVNARKPTVLDKGVGPSGSHSNEYNTLIGRKLKTTYEEITNFRCVDEANVIADKEFQAAKKINDAILEKRMAEKAAENAKITPLVQGTQRDVILSAIDKVLAANRNCVVMGFDQKTRKARVGLLTDEGEPCEVAVVALPDNDTNLAEGDIISVKGSVKDQVIVDAGYVSRSHAMMPDSITVA